MILARVNAPLHPLDNPVWSSLASNQQHLATGHQVKRYRAEYAPFIAVENANSDLSELHDLVAPNEALYFVGVIPAVQPLLNVESESSVLQMICNQPTPASTSELDIATLSAESVPDMLELTALVYPEFFRQHTHHMGRYIGIWQSGRLAAMAGERMFPGPYREISAVCTHPDFTGRGYAAHLITELVNSNMTAGNIPFLHVSSTNTRAIALYQRLGFTRRTDLPLMRIRRSS